ncbi:MAG: hypothetical protein EXS11_08695 [Gemmataceae bacterium]|nr:hypothetical protein [Gemmataceae bacterium]
MKQILVVTEDRPGLIADIGAILAVDGLNLDRLDAESIAGRAVVRIWVDKPDRALTLLAEAEYQAVGEQVLLIRLEDKPGALAGLMERFSEAGINLSSIRFVSRNGGQAIVALTATRTDLVLDLVKDCLIG